MSFMPLATSSQPRRRATPPEAQALYDDLKSNRPDLSGIAYGVIGLGEPPAIPGVGAIANAIANAIGVHIYELPITPDKVLMALQRKEGKA